MITQYQNYQQPTSPIEIQDLHTSHLIQNQSDSEHSYSNEANKSPSKSKPSSTIHSKTKTERKSKRNSRKCGELIKNLKWSTFLNQADTNNNNTSIIDYIEDMFDNPKPSEPQYNNNKLISNCDIKITNKKSHTPINNKRKDNSTNVDVDVNSIQKYKQYKIKKEYVYKHNNHNNDINKSMFLFKNKIKFNLDKVTPKKLSNSFITKMKINCDNQTNNNNKKEHYLNKEIKQNNINDTIHNTKNDIPNENNDKLNNNINHNNANNNNDNPNNNYETIKPKQPLLSKVITNKSKVNKALHYKPTPLLYKQINNLPLNPIKKKEQTHNNSSHKHSLSPRTTNRNNNKSNLNINTTNSNTSNLIQKLTQFKPKQLKQQQPYPKIPFANASFHSINNASYLPRSASSKQLTNTTNTSLPTQTKTTNSLRKPFTGITQDYIDKKKQFFMGLLKDPSNPYSICWSDKILNKGYGVATNVKGTVNCVPNLALVNLNNSNYQHSYANNTLYTPADITKIGNKNHLGGERMFSKVDDDCSKKMSARTSSCKLGKMNLDKYPMIQKYFS